MFSSLRSNKCNGIPNLTKELRHNTNAISKKFTWHQLYSYMTQNKQKKEEKHMQLKTISELWLEILFLKIFSLLNQDKTYLHLSTSIKIARMCYLNQEQMLKIYGLPQTQIQKIKASWGWPVTMSHVLK